MMEDSEGWVNISSEPLGERWASMSEPWTLQQQVHLC